MNCSLPAKIKPELCGVESTCRQAHDLVSEVFLVYHWLTSLTGRHRERDSISWLIFHIFTTDKTWPGPDQELGSQSRLHMDAWDPYMLPPRCAWVGSWNREHGLDFNPYAPIWEVPVSDSFNCYAKYLPHIFVPTSSQ